MNGEIVISDAGEIYVPQVHDAVIKGLFFTHGKDFALMLKPTQGEDFCLIFQHVERLRINDFRDGNIILSIEVLYGDDIDLTDVAYAYGVKSDENNFIVGVCARLKSEGFCVVKINPSYGCQLICVCKNIFLRESFILNFT